MFSTIIFLISSIVLWAAQLHCIQLCEKFSLQTTWPRGITTLLCYVDQYQLDLCRLERLSGVVMSKSLIKLKNSYQEDYFELFHGKGIEEAFDDVAKCSRTLFGMFILNR